MKTNAEEIRKKVHRPCNEQEFDVAAFLKDGKTTGYILRAMNGKPFLLKYEEPMIKEGRLYSLIIQLIDPNISKKDIVWPSYFSETFSHFFGPEIDPPEDCLELGDGGLVVAEIALKANGNGLLYLIDDLNYKHIQEAVLGKYYGSHRGEYDSIGRSMVGLAGKVLFEAYGIRFLGVKTDKTKGFYWEISDRPPKNPVIPKITSQLANIRDTRTRKQIREDFYINTVKKIAFRRFDPYMTLDCDVNVKDSWERHCIEIRSIFSENEPTICRLLNESRDILAGEPKEFIKRMMSQYREKNVAWFASINGAMRRLIEAHQRGNRKERDCIIDEMINLELDPIIREEQIRLKQADMNIDVIAMIYEIISHHSQIFPILDLSKIEEIEIGIRPHKKVVE